MNTSSPKSGVALLFAAAALGGFFLGGLSLAAGATSGHRDKSAPNARREVEVDPPQLDAPVVRAIALTVSSLPASVAFFRKLGFVLEDEVSLSGSELDALIRESHAELREARLRLGSERIELRSFAVPRGRPIAPGAHSNDAAFQHLAIVVGDIDAASQIVQRAGGSWVSPGPQTLPLTNPTAGGIRALYFLDPDRHNLELIWFPKGKGDPRWQTPGKGTFLGIDHSAIGVSKSSTSQGFYEGLGFVVRGRSFNFGPEQEALSGVPGARVRITGLRGALGPGIEFLEYEAEGPNASAPEPPGVADLWHWEITVEVSDIAKSVASLRRAGGRVWTEQSIDVHSLGLGYARAQLVLDPDGHFLRLVEGPERKRSRP